MNCAFHAAAGRSRALLRRARTRSADESGQSLMEVVLASVIFAVIATAMIVILLSSVKATNRARQKTLAQQAAATQIEQIRNLQYSQVGNTAGNPPGTVPLTTTLSLNGLSATETTKISYVNDPTPLSYQSYANYKKVSVTITRSSDGYQLARDVTYVAPPVKASQSQGQIQATVVDSGNNQIVQNYEVDVAGPNGFTATDTTDTSGQVTFAALTPTGTGQYYDVTVPSASGYLPDPITALPATGVHFALSPSQSAAATVNVYKPVTIYVQLLNSNGTTYAGSANVTVTSARGTQTYSYSGAQVAVTQPATPFPLVPGISYTVAVSGAGFYGNSLASNVPTTPPGYPTSLSSTFTFTNPVLATLTVTVQKTAAIKCNLATVKISGGPWNLGGPTNPVLQATTNASGLATFTTNVPVGTGYTITAKSVGNNSGTSTTTAVVAPSTPANTITVSGC